MAEDVGGEHTDEQWELLKKLYRECWRAYADIAALKMMSKAVEFSGELAPGWENRLEAVRSTEMYQQYLRRGEAEIDAGERNQANARLEHLLSKMRPPEFLN